MKIEFVRSNENDSDILTKNVSHEIYEKQRKKFLGSNEEYGCH